MAIIDPHDVFKNRSNVDISQLFYFVDLNVYKTNVLTNSTDATTPVTINFLGAGSGNTFTTNWTNNAENFGITAIQFKLNTSYVPQVDITFEDVRGQSLFNDYINSKYKVLFDFPPPIFELTLKGYYGQAVTYKLHLLRINSKLKSNGSFEISASFVGMTFAPLADILFDYLEVAPFLVPNSNVNNGQAMNTITLVKAANDLTALVKTATDEDRKTLNDTSTLISQISATGGNYKQTFIKGINNIDSTNLNSQNQGIIAYLDTTNNNIVHIKLKYYAAGPTRPNKLLITSYPITNTSKNQTSGSDMYSTLLTYISNQQTQLKSWKVIQNFPTFPNFTDILTPDTTADSYVVLSQSFDFTGIDAKITTAKQTLTDQNIKLSKSVISKTQSEYLSKIKGGANLRSVLQILMGDANTFYNALLTTVKNAQKNRGTEAFPIYKKYIGGSYVLSIPDDLSWDEVQFVDNYINAKIKAAPLEALNTTFDKDSNGNYKYVPINPFDSPIFSNNVYQGANNSNLVDIILERGNVFLNQTYTGTTQSLIQSYAKVEAYNIIETLSTFNLTVLQSLITKLKTTKLYNNTSDYVTSLNSPLYTITGASVSTNVNIFTGSYSGGNNYAVLKNTYFTDLGITIPAITDYPTSSDSIVAKTNTEVSNINSISPKFIQNYISGDKLFCQYNIPFYIDKKAKANPSTTIGYRSDYYGNSQLFTTVDGTEPNSYISQNDISTADNFLKALFEKNGISFLETPFVHPNFQNIAAIHEIPFFVLAWWGYVSYNYLDKTNTTLQNLEYATSLLQSKLLYINNWGAIPQGLQDMFKAVYDEYATSVNSLFSNYSSDLSLLISTVPGNVDKFFSNTNGFFSHFTETRYIVLGDLITLAPITNKQINFSTSPSNIKQSKYYTNYFDTLANELLINESGINKDLKDQTATIKSQVDDNDIRTQLYYSFKSFADRWMLNGSLIRTGSNTYDLFDVDNTFAIVDRAGNPIGDKVIMDLTPLWDTGTSPDTSLYTVLLNLLSRNNFEFFTLPTYLPYNSNTTADEIFGLDTTVKILNSPKFICMYVGGTSTQLDMSGLNIDGSKSSDDDGGSFNDIPDLSTSDSLTAFKVEIGTGNQSFFKNIDLDQLEFKETNESINLLDKIATQSQGNTNTIIKGNNLFNVYQQRSYSCGVEMMGNVMIQPTMYFELTNVAMWKGAYLILEVTHNITRDNFTTKFKGVRIPKYPKPYVSNYSLIANVPSAYGSTEVGIQSNGIVPVKAISVAASNNLGKLTNPNIKHNNYKALLDTIAYAEGTIGLGNNNGYDVILGNKTIPTWTVTYPLGHNGNPLFKDNPTSWYNPRTGTAAAGRYQFLYSTWVPKGANNAPFNLNNQDVRAVEKISSRLTTYNLTIDNITQSNFIHYVNALSPEWDSFPYNDSGLSYVGNPVHQTVASLWSVYSTALQKYS